jgi:hypothetical protein
MTLTPVLVANEADGCVVGIVGADAGDDHDVAFRPLKLFKVLFNN